LGRLRKTGKFYPSSGTVFSRIHTNIGRLKRAVEKQASYLTDITSVDGQRRRSRQKLHESFASGVQLVEDSAKRRKMETINDLPKELRSPPMFRAEIALVFSNLLTNAVKAAGNDGRIRAWGEESGDDVIVRVENTGVAVDLADADKWFRPFQSTTAQVEPALGQGMGMGLPITRDMLEEYGAEIRFACPSPDYATAVEIVFH
ncbi:MAG: ATP-binding protein, partial [Lentisphaerae bacterium]|nr:ATP-binding protein [Lentisphaerota bacterium]